MRDRLTWFCRWRAGVWREREYAALVTACVRLGQGDVERARELRVRASRFADRSHRWMVRSRAAEKL